MRRDTLLLVLFCAVSAWADEAPRAERHPPDLDAFLQAAPDRPFSAESLSASLRAKVELGHVSATEPRLGVPSFFWAPRERVPEDLRAAGVSPEQAARRALFTYAGLWRVDATQVAAEATARVHDLGTGAVIVTFALQEDGLEVFRDEVRVVMDQRLQLVALSGWLSPNRERSGGFALAEGTAIDSAFLDLAGAPLAEAPRLTERFAGPYRYYAVKGLPDVRIKKVFFPLPEGLEPAYYLELDLKDPLRTSARFYSYVVSARDGRLLLRHDLARYDAFSFRVWADSAGAHLPFDGPQGNGPTPHPTGVPDQYSPPFVAPELVTLAHGPISTGDPWLATGATETRGNNAFAYADIASPDGFNTGDLAASPSAAGAFDRLYDVTQSADFSPDQRMASVTQLFYNVNFFHDWYYDSGFDEKSGNAQASNLGRGGLEGDVLLAEAQDYSGTDNANMQTPADGASPRMQMYGFADGGQPTVIVNTPTSQTLAGVGGTLGPRSYSVTGDLAIVTAAAGGLDTGCTSLPASVAGKIAVVRRGTCQALQKATAAQSAGAIGLLIVSTSYYTPPITGGGAITIPIISMPQAGGNSLVTLAASSTVNVTLSMPAVVVRDGALDNAIVAHEWGHYVHNRLIGNANGLMNVQGNGMGEGWSDFHSLLMVVKDQDDQVASGANYDGVYALASYAMQLVEPQAYYFGIRRLPYSTNFTKNALTFQHISDGVPLPAGVPAAYGADGSYNSESHAMGEVWATMLWECYAALLRDRSRLTFEQAQTRMRTYLVASYKATPVNPTVLEARDALLAVAAAADPVDYAAFWAAFARRGAGLYATGPERASTDNSPVTESYAAGSGATIVSATLGDSVSSCDQDAVLDNGEKGALEVTIKNVGAGALAAPRVSISSSHPGVTALTTGEFGPVPLFGSATALVQLALRDAAPGSVIPLEIKVEDTGFSNGPLLRQTEFRVNFDVAPRAVTFDDVEVADSVWTSKHGPGDASSDWAIHQQTPAQHWWRAPGAPETADVYLVSPKLTAGAEPVRLTFRHRYEFERRSYGTTPIHFDGAVVEISVNDGATWADVGARLTPGYGGNIASNNSSNPLAGRSALVGTSPNYPAFIDATLDLGTAYAGQTLQVRFREGSDDAVGKHGWEIDDFVLTGIAAPPFPAMVPNKKDCQNQAPVASIEPAQQEVEAGAQVTLEGTGTDPDGDAIAAYVWAQTSGPTAELEGQGTASLTFTAPEVSEDTPLTFELRVSDGKVDSAAASAEVLVRVAVAAKKPGCGCSGGGFGPGLALLALGVLRCTRRRRPRRDDTRKRERR